MKSILPILSIILLAGCSNMHTSRTDSALSSAKVFPTKENFTKHVFYVEPLSDEHERKIEIIASKTIKKDCNQVRLLGSITQHTLSGWGYPYFQINTPKDAPYASTMMACPTQPEPTETNVSLTSQHLYRYNSKLPIVVYAPQSLHVNIRVWKPI